MNRLATFIHALLTVVCAGCTAEQLQRFDQGLAALNCGLEDKTNCLTTAAAPQSGAAPAQTPNLMQATERVFEDVSWAQLEGPRRSLQGWRVVDADGRASVGNIEIVFVNRYRETAHWCQSVIEAVFGNANKSHPACGCTRPGPPWRIVAIAVNQPGCMPPTQVLAHELWHTKGYWMHSADGSWPANASGQSAPRRPPAPQD